MAEVAGRPEGDIKICYNLRIFWKTLGKKGVFWAKNNAFGQELHYCMVYIAYCSELNLQVLDDFDDFPNNLNTIFKMIGILIHVHV